MIDYEDKKESENEDFVEDEIADDAWGEGCCEDELMDDEFYEREDCD